MKIRKLCTAGLLAATVFATSAAHAVVIVSKDSTLVDLIPGLTGFATSGDQMDGLKVTATFSSGFSETLFWADTGATSGGVTGTGWALNESGDTFGSPWNFTFTGGVVALQLVSLVLDATGPNQVTVFDTTSPSFGTDGSANGTDFSVLSGCALCDGTAVYSNAIGVDPAAPVGDLFHKLVVTFGNGTTGPSDNWSFRQDADNDSRLITGFVPEPSSLALFGAALAGLFATGRRRRRA